MLLPLAGTTTGTAELSCLSCNAGAALSEPSKLRWYSPFGSGSEGSIPMCVVRSRFEALADAFRRADVDNVARVESTVDPVTGARHYQRSLFILGAAIRMAATGLLRTDVFGDATFTKLFTWLMELVSSMVRTARSCDLCLQVFRRAFLCAVYIVHVSYVSFTMHDCCSRSREKARRYRRSLSSSPVKFWPLWVRMPTSKYLTLQVYFC